MGLAAAGGLCTFWPPSGSTVDPGSIDWHVKARHSQEPTAPVGPRIIQGIKAQPPVSHRRLGAYLSDVLAYFLDCQQFSILCVTLPLTDDTRAPITTRTMIFPL